MASDTAILAIDLGATNLRCALVAEDGQLLRRRAVATPFDERLGQTIIDITTSVRGAHHVARAVIGIPGRVDYRAGRLEWGRGQPSSWLDILTSVRLRPVLGMEVDLANDADLAAVGEAYFGAGDPRQDVVYLTVSSGLGAGAVLDGCLLRTRVSILEVGLTLITATHLGTDARFGSAVLEDLASGGALDRAGARAGIGGQAQDVVARAESGDAEARSLWDGTRRACGLAAVNLAHLLVPDTIVLGGGVSRSGESLRSAVADAVATFGPQGLPHPISVRLAALGDDAGLVGAAAWTRATNRPVEAGSR